MRGMIARSAGVGLVLASVSVTLIAGPAKKPASPANSGTPVVTDWSHRHLIFSHPTTPEQAARAQRDVRYSMQQLRLNGRPDAAISIDEKALAPSRTPVHARRRGRRMHRDWSVDLGPGATAGAAKFPAKFSFLSNTAACLSSPSPDFIVYGTSVPGSLTQSTIVAFTNLYSGCSGQVPGAYWGYNTGGQVLTSPVLSLDGKQVAFTQTTGGIASLVLLKWSAGGTGVQNPGVPVPFIPTAYPTCPAPCMTSFVLGANDTNSSFYYDYGSDTGWVGDDSGKLHQFTNVFNVLNVASPAEVMGGGWPVTVGTSLTSAVHDDSSGSTFVGDSGGFLYRVDSTGAVIKSGRLDSGTGLTEGPVVDSSINFVYAFSSNDGAGSAAIFSLPTNFAATSTGTEAKVGLSTASATPLYNGAFDHDYILTSPSAGHIWVCANPGGVPTLYQVAVTNGVFGAVKAGPPLSGTTETPCSPVTDVYNATVTGAGLPQEWVFVSTQAAGTPTPCGGFSCVMSFKITSWQPGFQYNLGQEVLDTNLSIQVADNSGFTSGATPPAWMSGVNAQTDDNGVHWRSQGPLTTQTPGSWAASTAFPGAFQIIDSNNNVEIAELPGGTSGATMPVWPTTEGSVVTDGAVTWRNIGANPVAALPAPGGTSGIIIDNTVVNPGGSQVYYSTLQDSACFTLGGVGGCAVQASQQGLQ